MRQFMLFGEFEGEIVQEVQVLEKLMVELGLSLEEKFVDVDDMKAAIVLEAAGWPNNKVVDRWYVECQKLFRR